MEVNACVGKVADRAKGLIRAGVALMKGPGDGVGVVPFTVGIVVSLEPLAGCSPKRRRAALKVASCVPVDVRGESPAVAG